jgi:hypothetical protein
MLIDHLLFAAKIFLLYRNINFWTLLLVLVYFLPFYFGYLYLQILFRMQEQNIGKISLIVAGLVLFGAWTYLMVWIIIKIRRHSPIRFR